MWLALVHGFLHPMHGSPDCKVLVSVGGKRVSSFSFAVFSAITNILLDVSPCSSYPGIFGISFSPFIKKRILFFSSKVDSYL